MFKWLKSKLQKMGYGAEVERELGTIDVLSHVGSSSLTFCSLKPNQDGWKIGMKVTSVGYGSSYTIFLGLKDEDIKKMISLIGG